MTTQLIRQPSLSVLTLVKFVLVFSALNIFTLPTAASNLNLSKGEQQNIDVTDPQTAESSDSTIFFQNSSPTALRQQYGQHAQCFNWYDDSPLDEGQQEVDGYCVLDNITPELDFKEGQGDTDIVSNHDNSQSDSSSQTKAVKPTTSSQPQIAESGSSKSVRLPGVVDLPQKQNTFSVISKSAFALPWSWKLGILLTVSGALTIALEQNNR